MDRLRRSDQLPYRMQTEAFTRYLSLACGAALLIGSLFVIWQVIASFGTGNPALGLALTLVLLGSAYLLLSLALQSIVLLQDRMVVTQWLFATPRTIFFSALDRLEQVTVGPADLLCIYRKVAPQPLRLLDLFPREDIFFAQEVINRSGPPPANDPAILRRAEGFRSSARPPTRGPAEPANPDGPDRKSPGARG